MSTNPSRASFVTTTRGLDRQSPPMKLFEKAKRYGIWNPSDFDLTQDRQDWLRLADDERDVLLRLTSQFVSGEEAVTLDLLPLIMTIAQEGRLEEEIFLTSFLWEEAKHTDFFQRMLHEVCGLESSADLSRYHTASYNAIFYNALPTALNRLKTDHSPQAQLVASVTYNMIVEGVLAETGYHSYFTVLQNNNIMPGVVAGVQKTKQDESRHIAYGIYLISRLVAEHPHLWETVEETMNALLMPAMGIVQETLSVYNPIPFGLTIDEFTGFAMMQFQKRMGRIQGAKGASIADVNAVTAQVIENEDA